MKAGALTCHSRKSDPWTGLEQRAQQRQILTQPVWLWRAGASKLLPAWICDQTQVGLGFTCFQALRIGEVIDITFDAPEGRQRWRLRIAHCESFDDDTFRLGAQRLYEVS
jgi:hypothetical protein